MTSDVVVRIHWLDWCKIPEAVQDHLSAHYVRCWRDGPDQVAVFRADDWAEIEKMLKTLPNALAKPNNRPYSWGR